jgi:hypothetical protein
MAVEPYEDEQEEYCGKHPTGLVVESSHIDIVALAIGLGGSLRKLEVM